MAAAAKRSKAKWDSEAERKITAILADITTSTVLHGSCADCDGNSECIRLRRWFLRSGKRREAVKWREGRSTKYDVRHFLFVLLLIRCDRLFAVTFQTVNVTVAVIFAVVWLPPKLSCKHSCTQNQNLSENYCQIRCILVRCESARGGHYHPKRFASRAPPGDVWRSTVHV